MVTMDRLRATRLLSIMNAVAVGLSLGMLLYKDTASTLSAMLSESVFGIANVIFLPPCVVGGLKGIWQAIENCRLTMQRREGGDLPTFEDAHSEMSRQGLFQAVENYRHTMQLRDHGELPTFEEAHSEMTRRGLFQAVKNYRHTMQLRDDGELPTFEDAHSEMSRKGVNNQVDDTRIAMQELVSAEVSSEMARSVHSASMVQVTVESQKVIRLTTPVQS